MAAQMHKFLFGTEKLNLKLYIGFSSADPMMAHLKYTTFE